MWWRIWRASNNANKWQMGFNSAFKEFNRIPNTNFHGNIFSVKRADTCGQTDGMTDKHAEANRGFSPLMKTILKMASFFLSI